MLARSLSTTGISMTDTGGKGTTPCIGFPNASNVHGLHAIAHRVRFLGNGRRDYTITAELHLQVPNKEAQMEAGRSLPLPFRASRETPVLPPDSGDSGGLGRSGASYHCIATAG
ncbi:hypothetical protein AB0K49_05150 [Streptomyces decoyicus]|uniref:hypothetical protein n=1 Tax=Streptomyces decoyicus TaxID=249567 RepID=UPI00345D2C3B